MIEWKDVGARELCEACTTVQSLTMSSVCKCEDGFGKSPKTRKGLVVSCLWQVALVDGGDEPPGVWQILFGELEQRCCWGLCMLATASCVSTTQSVIIHHLLCLGGRIVCKNFNHLGCSLSNYALQVCSFCGGNHSIKIKALLATAL